MYRVSDLKTNMLKSRRLHYINWKTYDFFASVISRQSYLSHVLWILKMHEDYVGLEPVVWNKQERRCAIFPFFKFECLFLAKRSFEEQKVT